MNVVYFRATQRDTRADRIMKCAAGVENIGLAVIISFCTDQEVTKEYLNKMAKEIEDLPAVNFKYFSNVKPIIR